MSFFRKFYKLPEKRKGIHKKNWQKKSDLQQAQYNDMN